MTTHLTPNSFIHATSYSVTELQKQAVNNLLDYISMAISGEDLPGANSPEVEIIRQAKYLTHDNVVRNDKGLQVCKDCGAGEAMLWENICSEFDRSG